MTDSIKQKIEESYEKIISDIWDVTDPEYLRRMPIHAIPMMRMAIRRALRVQRKELATTASEAYEKGLKDGERKILEELNNQEWYLHNPQKIKTTNTSKVGEE